MLADAVPVKHMCEEALPDSRHVDGVTLNHTLLIRSCEIGDKCAWQFDSTVTLANNSTWEIQDEWFNLAGACVQDQVAP